MNFRSLCSVVLCVVCMPAARLYAAEAGRHPHPFAAREHTVQRLAGEVESGSLPAEIQWISQPWNGENAQMPYLVFLPEKNRVLLLVECGQPIRTAFVFSDDLGKTWSERTWLSLNAEGKPEGVALGLTHLGGGKLMAYPENVATGRWLSEDYGATWRFLPLSDTVSERYQWDPLLVLHDGQGQVSQLVEASWRPTGVPWASPEGFYSQAYLRKSADGGKSWTGEVKVPQWLGVNEVALTQIPNGDWLAACRTDYPKRFAHFGLDHYGGLAISFSHDQGATWSDLNPLYEWGRHHPSVVMLPDGRLVMSYVVRLGYPDAADGFPQFGVEAVVSADNGQNWDLGHRFVLCKWTGNITGENAWFCSVQSTSTVLLPDGALITAFGTGFNNPPDAQICKMDVALVRWRLNE